MTKRTRTLWGSIAAAAMISLLPVSGAVADGYWQCVPFARLMSGIQIFGDARTWWSQAAGKYDTGSVPKTGSVLSFKPTGRMTLGHVAFVSQVLTDRVIQVTHANWSIIEGDRGQIERTSPSSTSRRPATGARSRSGTIRSATSAPPSIRPTASSIRTPRRPRSPWRPARSPWPRTPPSRWPSPPPTRWPPRFAPRRWTSSPRPRTRPTGSPP
jgi:hypothetical protein